MCSPHTVSCIAADQPVLLSEAFRPTAVARIGLRCGAFATCPSPFRGLGSLRDGDRRSPATTLPSWSSDPLQSVIGAQGSALSGYALPLRRSFGEPNSTVGYSPGHPAAQREPRSHPLLRFRAPPGHGPKVPQTTSRSTAPLLGFLPPSAHPAREIHCSRPSQRRVPVRLQGFSPSWRLHPSLASRAYFIPVTLVGFRPSGASPLEEERHLFGDALPS